MTLMQIPSSGTFINPEVWYWSTILIGFCFIGTAGLLLRYYLSQQKNFQDELSLTIEQLKTTDQQLQKVIDGQKTTTDLLQQQVNWLERIVTKDSLPLIIRHKK